MVSRILCFDIGGTTIRAALASTDGALGPVQRFETPAKDREAFFGCLLQRLDVEAIRPNAISVSQAGIVNPNTGVMIGANIPAIHGTRFAEDLTKRADLPVFIANDADCFAVAEAACGAGRGHEIVFGIILGTGVGGGLAVNGTLINQKGGFAGEWGHGPVAARHAGNPPIEVPAFSCGCGLSGCLDTVAGGRGLERLHRYIHEDEKQAPVILDAWRAGDARASRTIAVYLDVIAGPLAMAVNLTGATIVPAGGGLSSARDLVAEIDRVVRPLTLSKPQDLLVVPAASGAEPGLTGAALIAAQALSAAETQSS